MGLSYSTEEVASCFQSSKLEGCSSSRAEGEGKDGSRWADQPSPPQGEKRQEKIGERIQRQNCLDPSAYLGE